MSAREKYSFLLFKPSKSNLRNPNIFLPYHSETLLLDKVWHRKDTMPIMTHSLMNN